MKSLMILASLASVVLLAGFAPAQQKAALSPLVEGNNEFAFDLYGQLAKEKGNLFFSPYSISSALAMTYAGASGNTATEMKNTLRFPFEQEGVTRNFAELIHKLNNPKEAAKYKLVMANRLFGQKDYGFLPNFLKATREGFGAGLEEVDFIGATEEARKLINGWVEKQTQDKIKELLKPGVLSADSRLVLANAIYFKAAWNVPFEKRMTKPADFFTGAKKVQVPTMHAGLHTRFYKGDTFSALELPYEHHHLSMLVLLPKKQDGLAELEKQLTAANLKKWLGKLSGHMVDVALPKFKVTAEFQLNQVLGDIGMKDAFDRRKADFSGMTTREKLFISAVVHKAFVDVNEAGTEAAAATAVVMDTASLPPGGVFHADHPFVYLIRDNNTGSILFMGRVVDPT